MGQSPILSERGAIAGILGVSAALFGFLIWLIYFKAGAAENGGSVSILPAVNALLNGLSAACLVCGYAAIRARKIPVHIGFMLTAVAFSGAFLVCYVVYHQVHGDTKFLGTGLIRPVYFTVLISHIVCTMFALPMIFTTLFFAATKRFDKHKRLARLTLPLWLYVSVTGVGIYFLLKAHS